jgi:cyclopropane-fatty-acyl-phospholipid synthase
VTAAHGSRGIIERLFGGTGVHIGGPEPWDLQVHDPRFYGRLITQGSLGLGESYIDGWWDCTRIDEAVARLVRFNTDDRLFGWRGHLFQARTKIMNLQTLLYAKGLPHYDLGNRMFEAMLGPTLNYSCGYWQKADNLDEAQRAKMKLICDKLQLAPGQRLLDIGCGWGTLARFAAEHYGCEAVGITVSREQEKLATSRVGKLPVKFLLADYRELSDRFDKIVSVGMFEHVGRKNYHTFMDVARQLLAPDGLFLLHTIGNDHSATDAFLEKYLFPGGELPSAADLARATHGRFVIEDWHSFGADYDKTLMAWHANFERWAASPECDRDRRFHRMFRFYLLAMAGNFRARTRNQLWQLVLSPNGVSGGYVSLR